MNAGEVFRRLVEGNTRFANGQHALDAEVDLAGVSTEHHPDVAVLGCSDARIAPQAIFDLPLGAMFNVRVAGAVPDSVATASLVFAVEALLVPLIVVLGHDDCGAVAAARQLDEAREVTPPPLAPIVDPVRAALSGHPDAHGAVEQVINRWIGVLRHRDGPLGNRLASGDIAIVGGVAPIGLGLVHWVDDAGLGETPDAEALTRG